jgi:hypothetical protein
VAPTVVVTNHSTASIYAYTQESMLYCGP